MTLALTRRQDEILAFVRQFTRREQMPPTVYEIGQAFDVRPSTAFRHLLALQKKGRIRRSSQARSIRIHEDATAREPPDPTRVPLLRSLLGDPARLFSPSNVAGEILVDGRLDSGAPLFAASAPPDGAGLAGIGEGDILLVRRTAESSASDGLVLILRGNRIIAVDRRTSPTKAADRPIGIVVGFLRLPSHAFPPPANPPLPGEGT